MKVFECPLCKFQATTEEWNHKTMDAIEDDNIYSIDDDEERKDCYYFCPKCEEEIGGEVIREV